ncbi:MAG: sensor histidine kinase [Acidimicrobiales bacterium]
MLFALVVASADARYERGRVDRLLEHQVDAAIEQIRYTTGEGLVLGLADDANLVGGYPQLYVVELGDTPGSEPRVVFEPGTPFWPDAPVVAAAQGAADRPADADREAVTDVAERIEPYQERQQLRLLAEPVLGRGGEVRAVVVGVATTTSGQDSHDRLVTLMRWSAGAVVLFGLFVAVLMARGRFWLVDRALRRHEQFLHDTAHELRSPISALRTITEAGLAGDVPLRAALERAAHVVESTDQVVDDLMTLTRIETGRQPLTVERVRLDLLVEALVGQRADEPAVQVEARPTVIEANAELVRSAVGNLVENAVRHGRAEDPDAEVMVSVEQGRVTVADRGAGVAPQILTHLLERTDGSRRRTGQGLGLAIAGWVARVHGVRLEAANRSDGGAAFSLDFGESSGRPGGLN